MAVHAAVTGVLASATGDCIEVAIRRAGRGCNCTVFDVGGRLWRLGLEGLAQGVRWGVVHHA